MSKSIEANGLAAFQQAVGEKYPIDRPRPTSLTARQLYMRRIIHACATDPFFITLV